MIDGFGAVVDRLQGLLGKAYFIAGFLPALLIVLLSVPLVPLISPNSPFLLHDFFELSAPRQTLVSFSAVVLLSFAAFILWMANPWLRRLLEGRVYALPGLARWHQNKAHELDRTLGSWRPDVIGYRCGIEDKSENWERTLAVARKSARPGTGTGAVITRELEARMETVRSYYHARARIPYDEMESLLQLLTQELQTKKAEELSRLAELHTEFLDLASYAHQRIEHDYQRHRESRYLNYPQERARIESTTLANMTTAHEDYLFNRYGINAELVWPGIDALAQRDEKFYPKLEQSKTRLDFSVSMTAVLGLYTITWLALLLAYGSDRLAFVLIGALGSIAVSICYRLTVWNAYAFNASVRATIELFRFDLLKALHFELPVDSTAERVLWAEITSMAELAQGQLQYKHA